MLRWQSRMICSAEGGPVAASVDGVAGLPFLAFPVPLSEAGRGRKQPEQSSSDSPEGSVAEPPSSHRVQPAPGVPGWGPRRKTGSVLVSDVRDTMPAVGVVVPRPAEVPSQGSGDADRARGYQVNETKRFADGKRSLFPGGRDLNQTQAAGCLAPVDQHTEHRRGKAPVKMAIAPGAVHMAAND